MSVDAISAVFNLPGGDDGVSTCERLLLLAIADEAASDGECSAYLRTQHYLAWKCGWTDTSAVRKHLTTLELKGLLEVTSGRGGDSCDYRLTFVERLAGSAKAAYYRDNPEKAPPSRHSTGSIAPAQAVQNSGATGAIAPPLHIEPVVSVNTQLEKLSRWFAREVWAKYRTANHSGRHAALMAVMRLNPGADLRYKITDGLERFLQARERRRRESSDGFQETAPLLRNWIGDRRWEDE